MKIKPGHVLFAAAFLVALGTSSSQATNGTYLTGYGAESLGRGGANLAISDRAMAINFNPAGISQLQGNHLSFGMSFLLPVTDTENLINASTDAEGQVFPRPSVAYVHATSETPWTWGLAFVAQGGIGARYKNINSFFGTQDEIFSEIRFMTVTPTVAYEISEDLSVGASLNIGYSDVAFRFLPETSFFNTADPANGFFGIRMEPAGGLQYNLRTGLWWRPHPKFSLGLVYQTETESDFSGGNTTVDFTSHPLVGRKVLYGADVTGFTFPAQAGIGFSLRATPRCVLALDIKRNLWDDAIDTILVKATGPDVAGAPPEVVVPFVFDWQDQWVFALGGDYRVNDRLTVRGGYNYGENPVPDNTLTPLFPATVEHHLAVGLSWLAGQRTYEFALAHAFPKEQTNNNLDPMVNPFGPGSQVHHEQWTLSFSISTVWARKR